MEVNQSVTEGLLPLGGFDDNAFNAVTDAVVSSLHIAADQAQIQTQLLESVKNANPIEVKQSFAALSTTLLEAARADSTLIELRPIFEEAKLTDSRVKAIITSYEQNKSVIRATLAADSFSFSAVKDIEWRLDYHVKSGALEQVRTPVFFITLKTEQPDGSRRDLPFTCNYQQLQDMLAKFKDAAKQAERMSNV